MFEQKDLFEEQWFPQLFRKCKEIGLEWYRVAAIIYIKSGGDVQKRTIDWDYLNDRLSPDNPAFSALYDEDGNPNTTLIDRATRWGLFQILGDVAVKYGYSDKRNFLGLASVGSSLLYGLSILTDQIEKYSDQIDFAEQNGDLQRAADLRAMLPGIAEQAAFGVNPERVNEVAEEIKLIAHNYIDLELDEE